MRCHRNTERRSRRTSKRTSARCYRTDPGCTCRPCSRFDRFRRTHSRSHLPRCTRDRAGIPSRHRSTSVRCDRTHCCIHPRCIRAPSCTRCRRSTAIHSRHRRSARPFGRRRESFQSPASALHQRRMHRVLRVQEPGTRERRMRACVTVYVRRGAKAPSGGGENHLNPAGGGTAVVFSLACEREHRDSLVRLRCSMSQAFTVSSRSPQ